MKYLCLIYEGNETSWQDRSPEEQAQILKGHQEFIRATQEAGVFVGGDALTPSSTAVTVRVRNARPVYTDGPFAETKEQLGGFYMLDCKDAEEAREWAAKIPEAESGSVEVRKVAVFDTP